MAQQSHGQDNCQHSDRRMAHRHDFSHQSIDEEPGSRTPDSLDAGDPERKSWYLIKDQWRERDEYSPQMETYSIPRESRERLYDLERENRQLCQAKETMKEEIGQLLEIQKGMQEMLMRNQTSLASPLPKPQPLARTPPLPSPRTVYRDIEQSVLRPVPQVHPVPAPRRLPTPHRKEHLDATDFEAHLVPSPAWSHYPDSFTSDGLTHVPSNMPNPFRNQQMSRQVETKLTSSTPLMPAVPSHSQPYGPPANPVAWHSSSTRQETTYRGPQPTIPDFIHRDPGEFTRLKLALGNLLPEDATELFKYQVLVDHLKLMEARLIADSFLNSITPYTDCAVL